MAEIRPARGDDLEAVRAIARAAYARHVPRIGREPAPKAAVELYTNARMTENRTLYPRLGYRETGRRTEAGFDRVFYRKRLA